MWYDRGMTTSKIAISLPEEQLERVHREHVADEGEHAADDEARIDAHDFRPFESGVH